MSVSILFLFLKLGTVLFKSPCIYIMIISYWIFVAWLLDTPERRLAAEAKRITQALDQYYSSSKQKNKLY
jgi:uncharacterized membrane protein